MWDDVQPDFYVPECLQCVSLLFFLIYFVLNVWLVNGVDDLCVSPFGLAWADLSRTDMTAAYGRRPQRAQILVLETQRFAKLAILIGDANGFRSVSKFLGASRSAFLSHLLCSPFSKFV